MIFLQKIAIPVPGIPPLSVPMVVMLLSIGYMMRLSQLWISPVGLALYTAFAATVCLSHLLQSASYSVPSIMLLLILTVQQIIYWPVEPAVYRRLMRIFLQMMAVPAVVVFLQLVCQAVFGMGHTLNLEKLVPTPLLLPGYIYDVPIRYGASFVRPNGFFMLEPSYISAMLAIALLIEVYLFRRLKYMLLFFAALLGTLGATGLVLLAFAAPFVVLKQSPRLIMWLMGLFVAAMVVLVPLGAIDHLTSRFGELDSQNSSGADRLVKPLVEFGVVLADPRFVATGVGAGNLDAASAGNGWPMVKVASEYGLLAMLAYMALFLTSLARCPNLPLKIGLFVVFHLTGGYALNPIMNEAVVLLCMMVGPRVAEVAARTASQPQVQSLQTVAAT